MATAAILSLKPPASFFSGGNRRDGGNRTILARVSRGERFHENIVRLSVSTVLFLGLSSLRVCSPASAGLLPPPIVASENEINTDTVIGEENLKEDEDFEAYKSKVYSLTVPLKLVALRGSLPPSWIKEFMSSQGKRVRLKTRFRAYLEEIFFDLSKPSKKGNKGSASTAAADLISIGDSWLSYAIKEKLIEPMKGIEDQDWYKGLSDKWKIYLRRNYAGEKAPDGETWAVPYRWGTMVISYKKSKFQNYKLAPIEDWADLWRPELAGRIAMVNSPREVVGAVLKYMGASYNTTDLDSQVTGGRIAVENNLASLMKQIRLFDSTNYLKAFNVGDVWVTVGWSSDVIPVAKLLQHWFDQKSVSFGHQAMFPLNKLVDRNDGFLVNGEVKIVAEVAVLEVVGKSDVLEETLLVNESMDVNGFQVLPSQVESVNSLFKEHPGFASKFRLKNTHLRTTYFNSLLGLTDILCHSPEELSNDDLANAYSTLTCLTKAGFKLDWLEKKLKEVGKTRVQEIEEELKDTVALLEFLR